jgi:uncharacterized protein YjbI with pentapeptide repeats
MTEESSHGDEPPTQNPEYDQAFFLALAAKGKDAWNKRRRVNKHERVTFSGADFSKAPLDQIDFSGFDFGAGADFRDTRFGERAVFRNTQFGDGAYFDRAVFGKYATFERAVFGAKANFDSVSFGGVGDFSHAAFKNKSSWTPLKTGQAMGFLIPSQ